MMIMHLASVDNLVALSTGLVPFAKIRFGSASSVTQGFLRVRNPTLLLITLKQLVWLVACCMIVLTQMTDQDF